MMFIIAWIVGMVICGIIASSKNRSGFGWLILSLFISPLLAILLLIALPTLKDQEAEYQRSLGEKKCPMCAEFIKVDAKICKHCHSPQPEFEALAAAESKLPAYYDGAAPRKSHSI